MSTRSFGLRVSRTIVEYLRKHDVATTVVAGGWGPTLQAEDFLEFSDYVSFGEGEGPIEEICSKLLHGESRDFSDVSGMIFYTDRSSGHIKKNAVAEPYSSARLNTLPFPDYHPKRQYLIDRNTVVESDRVFESQMHTGSRRGEYVCFAGRGCPLNCTYCMSSKYQALYASCGHTIGKVRTRDVSNVIQELELAKANGAKFITIHDEVFPVGKNWTSEFVELYARRIGLPFFAYVRPEFHDRELIRRMAEIGLFSTVVGIQSGSERVRKEIYRRMCLTEKIVELAWLLRELGIEAPYHLINFNPFESEKDMKETLELLYKLP